MSTPRGPEFLANLRRRFIEEDHEDEIQAFINLHQASERKVSVAMRTRTLSTHSSVASEADIEK